MEAGSEQTLDVFAKELVLEGLLTETQAQMFSQDAKVASEPLIIFLAQQESIDSLAVATVAARYYSIPLYDISEHNHDYIPKDLAHLDLVQRYHGIPIVKQADKIIIAIADPNVSELQDIAFLTGLKTEYVLVEADKLKHVIDTITGSELFTHIDQLNEYDVDSLEVSEAEEANLVSPEGMDERPIVRFVNTIILKAIKNKASDIHFEPYEHTFRVRFRQDGILTEMTRQPTNIMPGVVARIKVMSNLDVSEHRLPQDGRFKMTISKGHSIDFRISTLPTLYGEKIVLRVLDPGNTLLEIKSLGMDDEQAAAYVKAASASQGIILVTGPTGSGKTVTLYSALNLLNNADKNISTIEDPIEIYMEGVNQVPVNPKIGMTFATALRAFLRQDPDIMMVGEIRDLETAEIAIKAAQTGHLVLSTLHTNSAPVTLSRLLNMGVQAFNIASSVTLIMAQRLVRKLCNHCKVPTTIPAQELMNQGFDPGEVSELEIFEPKGCDQCTGGFRGRMGIFEVMTVSRAIGDLIMSGGNSQQLAELAKSEGMRSLHDVGLEKVRAGLTSLEEVNRVISQ